MTLERFAGINVEAAEAARLALGRLTGQPVDVTMSELRLIRRLSEYPKLDPETRIAAVYLPVTGRVRGAALLWFPVRMALTFSDLLIGRSPAAGPGLSAMAESALKEAGNIICGNFVSVLANRLHATVVPGVPRLARDMCGAVTRQVIGGLWRGEREPILLLDVQIRVGRKAVEGRLCLCLKTARLLDVDGHA